MQGLCAILDKYSHIRLATEQDNKEILDFLAAQTMKAGRVHMDFRRSPDFFAFSKLHSDRYYIFLFSNDDGSLGGIATVLLKQRFLSDGRAEQVGYFGDLRVSPRASRKVHLQWRKCFPDIVEYFLTTEDSDRCHDLFTAVFSENLKAIRSLTEKLRGVKYQPVVDYNVMSLILPIPFFSGRSGSYSIDSNEDQDFLSFIEEQSKRHIWAPATKNSGIREWQMRSESWPNWSQFPTLIARDRNGEVLGSLKPWQDQSRTLFAYSLSPGLRLFGQSIKFLGRPEVSEGSPIKTLALTYFFVKESLPSRLRQKVAVSLLKELFKRGYAQRVHLVNWVPTPGDKDFTNFIQNQFLFVKTQGRIFRVRPTNLLEGQNEHFDTGSYYFDGTL